MWWRNAVQGENLVGGWDRINWIVQCSHAGAGAEFEVLSTGTFFRVG
jgi:hypothetical protein